MSLWIYLHFPCLQLNTLFTDQSENEEQATIIVDTRQHCVVQANSLALEHGVKLGMGLGSASALCAQLNVHPYDEKIEVQRLNQVAQWLYLVTSDIALYAPNGLLLKASNMLTLYSDLNRYWEVIEQHLEPLRLSYQFATGFSPFSAMLLAKKGINQITSCHETTLNYLSKQSLNLSELESKQVEQLNRVGIKNFSELLKIPLKEVARRFNIDLVNYVGRLLGQLSHPVPFFQPQEAFESSLELLYDIENIQWLYRPLTRLLQQLETFLTLRNRVAYELRLTLSQRDAAPESIIFTSGGGDYRHEKWQKLCGLTLESVKLSGPVYHLTLKAIRTGQMNQDYIDIFDGDKGNRNGADLIALLQAKLGNHNVTRPIPNADHRPEKSTRFEHADRSIKGSQDAQAMTINRLRPTRLINPPAPLAHKIELVHGPERIVTGWWDGEVITRDYFVALTPQSEWLWVFRTEQKQWFLHGYFS
ncbi:DNA polymerase Y family protein [Vibrio astriarenae]|uniref:DNA polymerase Y family protein n=1 Tax=Vibrio astriarenae TaxID=1481923 RepID=A0A7Z2T3I9_9VIBR|nr:DNA polymerase Y family protein [Vibrio astriarenae]QIA63718.1 DNA polymerase Y family protein [Vibrio astriarenae]